MKKHQIVTIILLVVVALLLLGSVVMLGRALSQTNEVAEQRDSKFTELEGFYRAPVFPDRANVKLYSTEAEILNEWTSNVVSQQRSVVAFDRHLTPSQFMQVLQPTIREMGKTKTRAGANIVGEGFAFGFDSYITGGQMPAAKDVPKLALQLEIVKRLCKELFEANIVSLRLVTRQQFESSAREESAQPARAPLGPRSRLRTAQTAQKEPQEESSYAIAGKHPFTLEFTARKEAALAVLNRLAATEMFVAVTRVSIVKTGADIRPPAADKREELKTALQPQRVVSGPEVDPLLLVRLNLTVEIF